MYEIYMICIFHNIGTPKFSPYMNETAVWGFSSIAMTINRIAFEPAIKTVIVMEFKRMILILRCKRKEASQYYKTRDVPKDDLSSLTNSALNVELVYAILLGVNTIIEKRIGCLGNIQM